MRGAQGCGEGCWKSKRWLGSWCPCGAEEGTHNTDGESGSAQGQSHPGGADMLAQQNDLPWERENNCGDI